MKFIFSDLDGTLLFDNQISQKDLDAIKKWKDEGNKFVIATGRGVKGMEGIIERFPNLADYYVLNNGAVVLNKDCSVIDKKILDRQVANDIIKSIDKDRYDIGIETINAIYTIGSNSFETSCPELGEKSVRVSEEELYNLDEEVIFINTYPLDSTLESAELLKKHVSENFTEHTSVFINKEWVDIVPPQVSKALGIKTLLNELGIVEDKVAVVGDSYNDIPMFEAFEKSFTFDDTAVRDKTNYIVKGVWEMVEELL